MNDDQLLSHAERLFDELVEMPPEQQRHALSQLAAENRALAALVEQLLASDASAGSFLESPAVNLAATGSEPMETDLPTPAEPPIRIGNYRIERQIGEGGMGAVYEAWQENPHRRVAVKVIRPGLVGPQVLARFQRESELLGKLSHPGVAAVYEAGVAQVELASGRSFSQPFYAMELVSGLPLLDFAARHRLSTRRRLELLALVCDAVEDAHHAGIVHRDLKPGNILVEESGRPKVLDFGIARAVADDAVSQHTRTGQVLGTVPYMSPEQISADQSALDARSDVYALGVIMFELLAGRLPYDLRNKPLPEAARIIRDTEPTRLSSASAELRGDLDTIVSKALEKDPGRRYQSAAQLGDDIRRHLADQPVLARPASTFYQFRKFARRNKALVGGVAATIIVLAGGVVATSIALAREADQRQLATDNFNRASASERQARDAQALAERRESEAQLARRRAEQSAEFSRGILSAISPSTSYGRDTTLLRETLARAADRVAATLADDPELQAEILTTIGETYRNVAAFDEAIPPLQRSLDLYKSSLGADHAITLRATATLAEALRLAGRAPEAKPLIEASIERLRAAGEPGKSDLANHLRTASDIEIDLGDLQSAEQHLAEAIDLASASADRRTLSQARASLGGLKRRFGRLDESRELLMLALDDAKAQGPGNEIQVGGLYNSLAILARTTGQSDQAESMYNEALRVRRSLYDRPHPDVAIVLLNLGKLYSDMGRIADAEPLLREALDMHRAIYPGDHQGTAIAMDRLGTMLQFKGQTDEALPLFIESNRMLKAVLGPDHPFVATSMSSLGNAYLELDRYPEAEQELTGALDIISRSMKTQNDAFRGPILALLGECSIRQSRYEESLKYLVDAQGCYDRLKVSGSAEAGWLENRLSTAYAGLGRFSEALDASQKAIDILERSGDRLRHALALAESATLLVTVGEFDKARERLNSAAEASVEHSTFRNRLDIAVARGYANLFETLDKHQPGNGYGDQARQWRSRIPPPKTTQPAADLTAETADAQSGHDPADQGQ